MKFHRINGLIIRHLYLYKRSVPRLMDIFYWPVMELLLWGFISSFIEKMNISGFNAVTVLLGAVIFWDFLAQSQRAVSVAFLEEVWERNFLNIFVTPIKVSEFIASTFILAAIRIFLTAVVMALIAFFFYHFNLFTFGFTLIPFMLNLLVFGAVLGLFTTAIILRYGTSAQVLAFGFIMLIQPFSAVFYPVSVLPTALQYLAYLIPSTHVFEGMRAVISTGSMPWLPFTLSMILNVLYMVLVGLYFNKMFDWIKRKGLLLELDQ